MGLRRKHSKQFIIFMVIAYGTAFLVERGSAAGGDSKLFVSPLWPIFFLIWYGLLYGLSYRFMKNWKLWQIGLFWAVAGPIIELILFRGTFRPTDILYSLMMIFPFWLSRLLARKFAK